MDRIATVAIALSVAAAAPASASTLVVNETGDHRPGKCTRSDCTLREAVIAANARPGADVISMPLRRDHTLSIESTAEDGALDGDLDITSGPLRIVHPGRGTSTIDADRTDRVFDIGAKTTLKKLTISGGAANSSDGGGDGGGILAGDIGDAPVKITQSRITGNRALGLDANGGGIDTDIAGRLLVVDSYIAGNEAGGDGGGITASLDGPTVIRRSALNSNRAGEGAGLMAVGPVSVSSSSFADNEAVGGLDGEVGDGAGIYVDDQGALTLTNSTLIYNHAIASGGGLFAETGAAGSISSTTIVRNRAASDAGGIHLDPQTAFALTNSILALNEGAAGAPVQCSGAALTNSEPNLVSSTEGGCDPGAEIVAADPGISSLPVAAPGPAKALPLLPGSAAIGAANPALSPPTDQSGLARDADPDLGALELR